MPIDSSARDFPLADDYVDRFVLDGCRPEEKPTMENCTEGKVPSIAAHSIIQSEAIKEETCDSV